MGNTGIYQVWRQRKLFCKKSFKENLGGFKWWEVLKFLYNSYNDQSVSLSIHLTSISPP